jgi:predicted acylesterase/phospholipase RssA/glycosidase
MLIKEKDASLRKLKNVFFMNRIRFNKKKYKLGLALSGGGAKGFAHIGVFRLLEECKLRPDVISGTSAGAIAGVLFADGYSASEIQELFTGRDFSEFAQLQIPKDGLFDNKRFCSFLERNLRAKRFEDLKTPLVVVATDLDNGKSREFRSGPIAEAVVASCSIPIIFSPVEINGLHYVDGGLFRNFPVSPIREECERVIGVNVSPLIPHKYKQTLWGIAERSYHYIFRANTLEDRKICDILIETEETEAYKTFDLENVASIADIGYNAAIYAFDKATVEQHLDIPGYTFDFRQNHRPFKPIKKMKKMIIYQVLPRLFGNLNDLLKKNGSMAENGAGKFSIFTSSLLEKMEAFGITHIWFTGVIEHATQTDYSAWGIRKDHSAIVKGKAGSPYAIKDYYDVDPDLAEQVPQRMEEFEQLLKRTHEAGMKVIIDFVANHVSREYRSDARHPYVRDLGQDDNTSVAFEAGNNFYYIPGYPLSLHFEHSDHGLEYSEFPAKATGNNRFTPHVCKTDWYETVKLNYGIDYLHGKKPCFYPVPDTWKKMLDILRFWAGKGVDGFRCDMAEMVPVEFWGWVIPQLKREYALVFIAEIYNPAEYRNYLHNGHFDYLYDKVGLYDTLRSVICRQCPAGAITGCWQSVEGMQSQMLNFLENHDEQRIASDFFAGDARPGIPGMIVATLMNTNPVMIYSGQELGERGMDEEGYSGRDGRTSIFDYWSMESVRNQLTGKPLSGEQESLRETYRWLLHVARTEPAIVQGAFYDLMYANIANPRFNSDRQYVFLRYYEKEVILVVANFDSIEREVDVYIPANAFQAMGIADNQPAERTDLRSGETSIGTLTAAYPYRLLLSPYSGRLLKFNYAL